MSIRTFLRYYLCTAVALLAVLSSTGTALGQQESETDMWMAAPLDLTLALTQAPPVLTVTEVAPTDSALTSTNQGASTLDESFDWREWRLEKRRQALKDTKFEFNLRSFYFDRSDFSGAEKQAWAIGGWLGVKTGYFLDHVAFGATVYTSNPIYAPDDRDGTGLLAPGQNEYTVMGEFYTELRINKDVGITVGAKGYDTPFINRNDTRMTPNTFEAAVLQGRFKLGTSSSDATVTADDGIGLSKDGKEVAVPSPTPAEDVASIKYGAGYFYAIKSQNDSEFVSMAQDAGADIQHGVWSAGALYEKGKFNIGAIEYYCDDVINIAYAQTGFELSLAPDWKLRFAGQYVDQGSVGENLLQGHSFSGHQFGVKVELPIKNALFTAAFTQAWGTANLQNPWSGYPGYTSVQVQDFNRDGEGAFLLRAGYDFPWVDGLSAYALAVFGTDPDLAGQFRQNEFDANLQWGPKKGALEGLSLRLRYAVVQQFGGDVHNLTDFRAIFNYVVKF
ncbi:MAG: OprD family outer membrane porin [Candidatus Udaeobacter sp.]